MINYKPRKFGHVVEAVQLSGLEHAKWEPPEDRGSGYMPNMLPLGNDDWRSPEAFCDGSLNKPSDVFSFGLVVSSTRNLNVSERRLTR